LAVAARGARDMRNSNDPASRMTGVRNVVVWGRSVAHVLEHLRGAEPDFDSWYQRYQNDPVMEYLVELRNRMLKEGELPTQVDLRIREFDSRAFLRNSPPPPGAKSYFIGDEFGGNGWEVELPDGEIEKFYVQLPRVPGLMIDNAVFRFAEAPLGFRQMPVQDVCDCFMRFLRRMVADAEGHFRKT
jgi:hypothetical protein